MKIVNSEDITAETVEEGAEKTTIRWLIAKDDGAPNFAMRLFEIAPEGCTPRHQHAWEHEVFVLSGSGVIRSADGDLSLGPGTAVLVEPNDDHQFRNTGDEPLRMICLIPHVER